jgi:hypothetical protein
MATTKRALLIGCNYSGTGNALYGCINDIIQLKGLLIDVYGFAPSEIVTLRDDDPSNMPRRERILQELQALVAAAPATMVLVYSGHGSQIGDASRDETDGRDEVIVPSDLKVITDDELNAVLKPFKGSGLAIFDCCHSGTILDLSFNGVKTAATTASASATALANSLVCFSGCQDNDVSMETFADVAGLPQGAMTAALIAVLRRLKYFPAVSMLWTEVKKELKGNGFSQVPQLSASAEVTAVTPFPLPNVAAAELAALRAQVASLQSAAVSSSALQTTNSQIPALQTEIATLKTANAQIPALQTEIATLKTANAQIPALQAQVRTLQTANAQIPTLQAQVRTLQTANAQIPTLQAQVRTLQTTNAQIPALQRQIRDQQALLAQIPILKAQLASLQTQLVAAQRQLAAKK